MFVVFVKIVLDCWDSPPSPASMSKFPSRGIEYFKIYILFFEMIDGFGRIFGPKWSPTPTPIPGVNVKAHFQGKRYMKKHCFNDCLHF